MSNTLDRYLDGTEFTNLSVKANCDNTDDGSIEASGTLYINNIKRYDINVNGINIENTIFNNNSVIINSTQNSNLIDNNLGSLIVKGGINVSKDSIFNGLITSNLLTINGSASIQKITVFNTTSSSFITLGGISIQNTVDAVNLSMGGGLTILGGASIAKTLLVNILNTNLASISNLTSINSSISSLYVNKSEIQSLVNLDLYNTNSSITNLNLNSGTFGSVSITSFNNQNFYSNSAIIDKLTVGNLYVINNIEYNDIVTNLTATNITSTFSSFGSIQLVNGTFSSLYGTFITASNITTTEFISNQSTINNAVISNLSTSNLVSNSLLINDSITGNGNLIVNGQIVFNNTLDATSYTNGGSLTINGGISVLKNVYVGESIYTKNLNTKTIYSETADIIGLTAGNINFTGNLYQNGELYVSSQWTLNNIDKSLSYTNGNVGINTTIPKSTLDINGILTVSQDINVKNSINSENTTSINSTITNLYTLLNTFGSIYINSSENASSLTFGGSLTNLGGMSIQKDVYIGGNTRLFNNLDLNNNNIINVKTPINGGDAVNKNYIDTRFTNFTTGNVNGNFTQGQVIVATTAGNIIGYDTFTFNNGTVSINTTIDAVNLTTPGSFISFGGASIVKSLFVGNGIDVNNKIITNVATPINRSDAVNKEYIDYYIGINNFNLQEQSFTLTNDITTPTDIVGFLFNSLTISSFDAQVYLQIDELNTYSTWKITGVLKGDTWNISNQFIGDYPSYVNLTITKFGQMQYTNTNTTGIAILRFKADTISQGLYNNPTGGNVLYIKGVPSGSTGQNFFTSGSLLIGNGSDPIYTNRNLKFTDGTLLLTGTTNSSIISYGGASIAKGLFVGNGIDLNNKIIKNVATPINGGDAVTKDYVDNRTIGNMYGNFSQGQVLISGSGGSITSFENFSFDGDLLKINSTKNTSFINLGGASILKSLFVGNGIDVNNKIIKNVATPINAGDAVTKDYVDNHTIGNINGNFLQGQILVSGTSGSITAFSDLTFTNGFLSINSTNESTSLTNPGSFITYGSANILKSLFVGNGIDLNNKSITNVALPINSGDAVNKKYFDFFLGISNGDIREKSVILNNEVTIPQDILGFVFSNEIVSSFESTVYIEIPTLQIYDQWKISGLLKGNTWDITSSFFGVYPSYIYFTILNKDGFGQIQYTNSNPSGIATIRFRATTTSQGIYQNITVASTFIRDVQDGGTGTNYFTSGTLLIGNGLDSLYTDTKLLFTNGSLILGNTQSATSLTSNTSLISHGGISIQKNLIVGDGIDVSNTNISNVALPIKPSDAVNKKYVDYFLGINGGDIKETSFVLVNNTMISSIVPDFIFNNNLVSTFKANVFLEIKDLDIYTSCEINGVLQGTKWVINKTFIGTFQDKIDFTINNIGQIYYTNKNTIGICLIRFKATTTSQGTYVNLTIGNTFVRDVQDGGTGQNSFSHGSILIGNGSNGIYTDSFLNFTNGSLITNSLICTINLDVNNSIIKNVSIPIQLTDAANKEYVDNTFNSVGNLNASGQVIINNTTNSNSNSTGALVISGGLGIEKTVYIGEQLFINNINVSPSRNDISFERQFYGLNNIENVEDIMGFSFNSSTRFFTAFCSVTITTLDYNLKAGFNLEGIQIDNGWMLNSRFIGQNTNIVFSINNSGQIQYTSSNIPNFISNLMKFRALTTTE